MKKHKKNVLLSALFAGSILALSACGGGGTTAPSAPETAGNAGAGADAGTTAAVAAVGGNAGDALAALEDALTRFPLAVENNNPILQSGEAGNIIRGMVASDATLPGTFEITHQNEAFDAQIHDLQNTSFVTVDETMQWTDSGVASLRIADDQMSVTLTLLQDIYWHDGVPVTMDDLVFAYEMIGHPDHRGIRYTSAQFFPYVVGMEAYRAGSADYISGLVLSDANRTLTIHYTQPLPPSAMFGGSIWVTPTPRHWLEPAIAEVGWGDALQAHPRVRHEALGNGPWIIDTVVAGESVLFRANDNYWRGRPLADQFLWEIVPSAIAMASLREGLFDMSFSFLPAVMYEEHLLTNPTNYTLAGWQAPAQSFLSFRVGYFEETPEGQHVTWRSDGHPITDVNIRRALAYSTDMALKGETLNNGLAVQAGSAINPFNGRQFIDPNAGSFAFNPAYASQILDEAGYTERGADGFRLDLNGNPMSFNLALNDNQFNNMAAPTFLQNWREIGLDVNLYTGDTIEWNTFLDNLSSSDNWSENVHILWNNWNSGFNPNPGTLWGPENQFNMARYSTPELTAILNSIVSQEAFDPTYSFNAYQAFHNYFYENAIALPGFWNLQIFGVNNRVANFDLTRRDGYMTLAQNSHLWGLTAPTAYVN